MGCFAFRPLPALLLACALVPLQTATAQEPRVPGSTRPDPPPSQTGRVVVVTVGNQMPFYSPVEIVAHVGDTIVWQNVAASDTHALVSARGGFSSSDIAAGAEWKTTITRPGESSYECRYHPWMRGTITATWPSAEFIDRSLAEARRAGLDRKATSAEDPSALTKAASIVNELLHRHEPRIELPAGAVIAAAVESPTGQPWWLDRARRKLATFRNGWIVEYAIGFDLDESPSLVAGGHRVWFSSSDGHLNYLEDGRIARLVLPDHLRNARIVGDGDENVWALMGGNAWLLKQPGLR
jgi:plastocyanin